MPYRSYLWNSQPAPSMKPLTESQHPNGISSGKSCNKSRTRWAPGPVLAELASPEPVCLGCIDVSTESVGTSYSYSFSSYLPHRRRDRRPLFEESIPTGVKLGELPPLPTSPRPPLPAPRHSLSGSDRKEWRGRRDSNSRPLPRQSRHRRIISDLRSQRGLPVAEKDCRNRSLWVNLWVRILALQRF